MDLQAEHLQENLDRVAAGEPMAEVLRAPWSASSDADQGALVELAVRLSEILPLQADPVFRAHLQAQLQAELAQTPPAAGSIGTVIWRWQRWFLRLSAAVLVLALAFGTAVRASADSLPGTVLYPVKRAAEEARLALAWTASWRALVQIDIAGARIDELTVLVARHEPVDPVVIDVLITTYGGLAEAARDPALAGEVAQATAEQDRALSALARATDDPGLRSGVDRAQRALDVVVITLNAGANATVQGATLPVTASPTGTVSTPASMRATATATGTSPTLSPGTSAADPGDPHRSTAAATATLPPATLPSAILPTTGPLQAAASATAVPNPAATQAAAPESTELPPTNAPTPPAAGGTSPSAGPTNPDRPARGTAIAEKTRDAATREAARATRAAPQRPSPQPEGTRSRPIPTSPPVVEPTREIPPPPPATPQP